MNKVLACRPAILLKNDPSSCFPVNFATGLEQLFCRTLGTNYSRKKPSEICGRQPIKILK